MDTGEMGSCGEVIAEPSSFSSTSVLQRNSTRIPGAVIIVDDDRSFVDAMAIFLEDHGFDVTKAYSALEAIRALSRRRVDVAIIDVHLPDQEGTNVAHLLRQSQPFTPILLISSDDSDDTLAKCLKVKASAFMAKPLMPREILESVSRACDRVRTGQSLGPAAAAHRSE